MDKHLQIKPSLYSDLSFLNSLEQVQKNNKD